MINLIHTDHPQPPKLTKITPIETTAVNSILYLIQWLPPSNIKEFDLDHYELIIMNETVNMDPKENSAIISIKKGTASIAAHITAVDRCGTKGISSSDVIDVPILSISGTGGLNNGLVSNTTSTCSCGHEMVITIVIMLISFITLLVVIAILIISVWKIRYYSKPDTRTDKERNKTVSL